MIQVIVMEVVVMSDMRLIKGKMIELSHERKTEITYNLIEEDGFSLQDLEDDFIECLLCTRYENKIAMINGVLYELLEFLEDRDPDPTRYNLKENDDGTIDFDVYWYNCCGWEEVIGNDELFTGEVS